MIAGSDMSQADMDPAGRSQTEIDKSDVDALMARLAARLEVDAVTARGVLRIVLKFLDQEAPPDVLRPLLDAHPWIPALVAEVPAEAALAPSTRHLGGMGRLMQAADRLMALGLTMGQVQAAVHETVTYARETVGAEPIDRLVRAVPGLRQVA
ncbi:hypothetical protein V5F53_15775 [Xanthobacter sp. V4C-4]|uniref:hypothetical protein n=1 Tax=Xanthobacter cornucopiae TaxID=3119924 RepID=UPI00372A125D